MPEVFRELGFVFFFYSNEGQEPMHVHVRKTGGFAKFVMSNSFTGRHCERRMARLRHSLSAAGLPGLAGLMSPCSSAPASCSSNG